LSNSQRYGEVEAKTSNFEFKNIPSDKFSKGAHVLRRFSCPAPASVNSGYFRKIQVKNEEFFTIDADYYRIFSRIFDRMQRKIYHARLMYARSFIDSLDFAQNGKQIDAEVPFAELPRLLDVLDNPQGVLQYSLHGVLDSLGNPALDVRMSGLCQLRCQRCLKGMEYAVDYESRLLLRDEAVLEALQDDNEEFDSILADAHLDVLELLEEEILLSLPIAPKHDLGACRVAVNEKMQKDDRHPFAMLEKLKRN